MGSTYLRILFRYTFALIFAMFLKVLIIDIAYSKEENLSSLSMANYVMFKYEEVDVVRGDNSFKKPYFNNDILNNFVDNYINNNSCTELNYNVFKIDDKSINVFLNCGLPKNLIFNHTYDKNMKFDDLLIDKTDFKKKEKELLKLKYPTFVVDDIDYSKAVYDIKENEIIGYYDSPEFGSVSIRINNNEIKDLTIYEMHYDDAYENETYKLDPNKKTIAFTFDDGPSKYDIDLVNLLVDAHASGTFFVVGNRIENFPDSIKKMVDANMEVGNHTYNHKSLTSLSSTNVKEQITKTNDIFYKTTGKSLTLFRPSYGAVNKRVMVQVGMPTILWSIDTLDWKVRDALKVYDVIMNNIEDGDIVLMHSLYETTVEAVKMALPELYKRGIQAVSVSELAELKGQNLRAGSSYLSVK